MKSIILFLLMASPAMAFDVTGNLPTALGDGRYVLKTGDTMSGPLTLAGSSLTVTGNGQFNGSAFSVGGSTLVVSGGKVGINNATLTGLLNIDSKSSNLDAIYFNREFSNKNSVMKFGTANVDRWIVGNRNDSTENFTWYNYAKGADILTLQ